MEESPKPAPTLWVMLGAQSSIQRVPVYNIDILSLYGEVLRSPRDSDYNVLYTETVND